MKILGSSLCWRGFNQIKILLDTPISSVMCADMLPLAKAESPIGSYTDKDRVNHECILLFIVFIN